MSFFILYLRSSIARLYLRRPFVGRPPSSRPERVAEVISRKPTAREEVAYIAARPPGGIKRSSRACPGTSI
jgi:hypothetical protein